MPAKAVLDFRERSYSELASAATTSPSDAPDTTSSQGGFDEVESDNVVSVKAEEGLVDEPIEIATYTS